MLALGKAADAATIYESLAASETERGLACRRARGHLPPPAKPRASWTRLCASYTALAESSQRNGSFYLDRALFAKARILEKQGKGKDAEQALRDILNKVPKTSLRPQIDDRLAVLGEK